MWELVIGFVSAILLLLSYSYIERKRVKNINNSKYLFIVILIFASFLLIPQNNLFIWFCWLIFFYTMLDDMQTGTVFIPHFFIIVGCVLYYEWKTYELLDSKKLLIGLILLVLCLYISKKTKETFFSMGDSYAIACLYIWFENEVFISILLSIFFISMLSSYLIKKNLRYIPYLPFLTVATLIVTQEFHVKLCFAIAFGVQMIMLLLDWMKKTTT